MNIRELEKLVTKIANSLLGEGEVIRLANDYRVSYIQLYFKDEQGQTASSELFHGGRHGDDREGKHPNATIEEAADACLSFLKSKRDWAGIARKHGLYGIYFIVDRMEDAAKRYLYNVGGGGVDSPVPDDPLIVF